MRQIGFQYDELPNEFVVTYDDRLISFLIDRAKRLNFTFEEQQELRHLLFSMGWDSNLLTFPISQREFPAAILGVMDPYTLGELDNMTLDFKMWPDMSGLIPSGLPGADGLSIFDFTDPWYVSFPYESAIRGDMDLGIAFMGGYGLPLHKLKMFIRNSDRSRLTELIGEKFPDINKLVMHLSPTRPEMLNLIDLCCKSVLGKTWTLGDMDPFTLGYFDPIPLWQLTDQTASALQITTAASVIETNIEPEIRSVEKQLKIEGKQLLHSEVGTAATDISKRLSSMRSRRYALLGDMDTRTFDELDNLSLDMRFYGKIPAIVTVEAES